LDEGRDVVHEPWNRSGEIILGGVYLRASSLGTNSMPDPGSVLIVLIVLWIFPLGWEFPSVGISSSPPHFDG
jgi:hypothetical protein